MPRTVWKGAISFGLVHIPVALRAASRDNALDFDWLDRRDMAPVGYQRINKRTGEPIAGEDVVKGYAYESGQYVLMTDEDFRAANPQATQTVDILGFVDVADITPEYFETPYYLEALRRGEKGYALLRQVLRDSGRCGLASVVIGRKQHLATLRVQGEWLMLNTLRWADEVLAPEDMASVDDDPKKPLYAPRELEMAARLVDEMVNVWDPAQYKESYREDLLRRIDERIAAGRTHELAEAPEEAPAGGGAQVIDLMQALRASLARKGGAAPKDDEAGHAATKPRAGHQDAGAPAARPRKAAAPARAAPAAKKKAAGAPRAAARKRTPAARKQA